MDSLVTCPAHKKAQYLDNDIFEIRLPKTIIFVKMCSEINIFKIRNRIVIFEKHNILL